MQRSRFRVEAAQAEGDFGWMAGGQTSRIAADVALTGSSATYHSFAVEKGASYAVRVVSFVDITVNGLLWTGVGVSSPATAALIWFSSLTKTDNLGAGYLVNATSTTLAQVSAPITATGIRQVIADAYIDVTDTGIARVTHAITAGAAGNLKAGSFATIHRLS